LLLQKDDAGKCTPYGAPSQASLQCSLAWCEPELSCVHGGWVHGNIMATVLGSKGGKAAGMK
jgi:hypothetical protein